MRHSVNISMLVEPSTSIQYVNCHKKQQQSLPYYSSDTKSDRTICRLANAQNMGFKERLLLRDN